MPSWKRTNDVPAPPGVTQLRDGDLGVRLESLMANAAEHIRRERELLLGGATVPLLPARLRRRPMLVVRRAHRWQADLAGLKRWIHDRDPVLVGVGHGVEALLDAGYKPDVAIGSLEEISDVALNEARHVVVTTSSEQGRGGADRFERAGVDPQWFIGSGKSTDLALLLGDANEAEVVVEAGGPSGLSETLAGSPDQVASSFVTRLRMNQRVVDASAVSHLSAKAASTWPVLLLLLAGVVAVGAALAVTPVGNEWLNAPGGLVERITDWVQGLTS